MTPSVIFEAAGNVSRFRFTGKERDAESGNDYFGAQILRRLNGKMVRWLSPATIHKRPSVGLTMISET